MGELMNEKCMKTKTMIKWKTNEWKKYIMKGKGMKRNRCGWRNELKTYEKEDDNERKN